MRQRNGLLIGIIVIALAVAGLYIFSSAQKGAPAQESVPADTQESDNGVTDDAINDDATIEDTTTNPDDSVSSNNPDQDAQSTPPMVDDANLGLKVTLPESWAGFTLVETEWEAQVYSPDGEMIEGQTITGPKLLIRHPNYTDETPRQDLPILVLTHDEWIQMSETERDQDKEFYHIGAAPIGPSLLAENEKYVFALPARYNFEGLEGLEEVQELVESGAVEAY